MDDKNINFDLAKFLIQILNQNDILMITSFASVWSNSFFGWLSKNEEDISRSSLFLFVVHICAIASLWFCFRICDVGRFLGVLSANSIVGDFWCFAFLRLKHAFVRKLVAYLLNLQCWPWFFSMVNIYRSNHWLWKFFSTNSSRSLVQIVLILFQLL